MNVVAMWRARAGALGREGWKCRACGRLSLVRRRLCAGCGALTEAVRAPLPRRGQVAALSSAGAAVEHLDQVTGRKPALLVVLAGASSEAGARIACLLCHADSVSLLGDLRGHPVRLAVRRISLSLGDDEPIGYGVKAAVSLETRRQLMARRAERASAELKKEQGQG
jgi:uncharacterized OB-fold protein